MIEQHPNWEKYARVVSDKCFDCIQPEHRVLEVGPNVGSFTRLIIDKNPTFLELVEPDPLSCDYLRRLCSDRVLLRKESIFDLLPTYRKGEFDVVVAFGVLYHWSSPFDFLEQIVNNIQPQYLCLDNPNNDQIIAKDEDLNTPGNLFTDKHAVGISLHLPPDLITKAMQNLGYKQLLKRQMSYFQVTKKEQSWIWKFERI